MAETLRFHYDVDGDNFTSAGAASVEVKRKLRQLGFPAETPKMVCACAATQLPLGTASPELVRDCCRTRLRNDALAVVEEFLASWVR